MRILITGSNGLLGQKIVRYCNDNKINFLATSTGVNRNSECRSDHYHPLDITNKEEVESVLLVYKPTHIINTAALTNVDKCEENVELCNEINVEGVRNLLEYARNNNCHLQQISTDFIFDGEKGDYSEDDEPNPLSEYGKSKLNAELLIINSGYDYYSIVRTSVVYGTGENLSKSNIVLWAIEELKNEKSLKIVDDQFRAPTYAMDLAIGCMKILELKKTGVFNLAGPKVLSMFDFVSQIAEYLNVPAELVSSIKTPDLNQRAPRPKNSGLNLGKAKKVLDYQPSDFNSTLFLMEVEN